MPVSAAELAGIPLFASLGPAELEEVAGWFDAKSASEGVRLAGESAVGYSFFVIADGNAVVTANGTAVATLGPGDFFGEIAILGDGRRSATVTTTRPARLFVMYGAEFRQLQERHPDVAAGLEAVMAARTAAT
jgi:voltage-gated potassium channel